MVKKSNVIPFGKYAGDDVVEVMARDPKYIEWLKGQAWFADNHPAIYNTVINVRVSDDDAPTPDHNAMQAKFLNDELCRAVLRFIDPVEWNVLGLVKEFHQTLANGNQAYVDGVWVEGLSIERDQFLTKIINVCEGEDFESLKLTVKIQDRKMEIYSDVSFDAHLDWIHSEYFGDSFFSVMYLYIELKPAIGDDYPTVIRQINKQKARTPRRRGRHYRDRDIHVLIYDQFSASGITEDQMRQIFEEADIRIATLDEIEDLKR